jgi:hypothetical protein
MTAPQKRTNEIWGILYYFRVVRWSLLNTVVLQYCSTTVPLPVVDVAAQSFEKLVEAYK